MAIIYTYGRACSCDPEDRATEVKKSLGVADLIFCGELIPVDNCDPNDDLLKAYQFRIDELFKGDYPETIINGCITGMCSILPQDKGLWLVYARVVNDSTIEISKCSPTISLSKENTLIPPPSLDSAYANQRIH